MNWTSDQARALVEIERFYCTPKARHFVLEGYAGTGKTTVIQERLRLDLKAERKVAAAAPTNKAVRVLKTMGQRAGLTGVDYLTIHQLLALKAVIDPDTGREMFVPDKRNACSLSSYDRVVIDEASMVNRELYDLVVRYTGKKSKVIWLGDPAQLPPVGELHSPTFELPRKARLTEIVRHGGAIQEIVNRVRDGIGRDERCKIEESHGYGEGVWTPSKGEWLERLLADFKDPAFQADSGFVRALAWTNRVCAWGNDRVHAHLYGKHAEPFIAGQRLIANSPVVLGATIMLTTSEECTVERAEPVTHHDLRCWRLTVTPEDADFSFDVIALDPSSVAAHEDHLGKLRQAALSVPADRKRAAWGAFYLYKNAFADVGPIYWSTVHKAQGSTFERDYVALGDIERNQNAVERQRMIYTAMTRASKQLVIARS